MVITQIKINSKKGKKKKKTLKVYYESTSSNANCVSLF